MVVVAAFLAAPACSFPPRAGVFSGCRTPQSWFALGEDAMTTLRPTSIAGHCRSLQVGAGPTTERNEPTQTHPARVKILDCTSGRRIMGPSSTHRLTKRSHRPEEDRGAFHSFRIARHCTTARRRIVGGRYTPHTCPTRATSPTPHATTADC